MSGDNLPTVWEAEPHTRAKHDILRGYLQAWLPILSRHLKGSDRRVLFVDGFAGPGIYRNGVDGSPVLALRTALEQADGLPTPVHFLFIEQDLARFETLKTRLVQFSAELNTVRHVRLLEPQNGDCEQILKDSIDECAKSQLPFGPALVFLDQFGYSAVSMNLIAAILKEPMCEIFSYLQWRDMNRFITDETKWPGITRAFGGDEWRPAINLSGGAREKFLLDTYRQQLGQRARAKFVWSFAMCDENDQLLYWLFFATNSDKGLIQMKQAMLKVDDSGEFRFSDGSVGQFSLLKSATDGWLANHLSTRFANQTLPVKDIEAYVLRETPCYKYADVLGELEGDGRLEVSKPPPKRKKRAFKGYPDMLVRFLTPSPPAQRSLFDVVSTPRPKR